MDLEKRITKEEAAVLLRVDPRAIERYADKGFLTRLQEQTNNVQHRCSYLKAEVNLLRIKFKDRKKLDGIIREIYTSKACGMSEQDIMRQYNITRESVLHNAMQIYVTERKGILKGYGIDSHEDRLLGEEVKAKLTITDSHVIGDLIDEGLIKAKTIETLA